VTPKQRRDPSETRPPRRPSVREGSGDIEDKKTRARLRDLRSSADVPSPDRLFLATLRIRIPTDIWTGPFSSAHPIVRLEVLNRTDVKPGLSVSDYWISGPPGAWAQEIATFSDVIKVDSLAEVGQGCLYRITYRNPPIVALYQRLRLPLQFPLRLQAGYIAWEVVARYGEFQEIMAHARRIDPNVSILSIRRRPLRSHLPLLTSAQHELLTQAMAAGYFAVPRGITLTALARKLERSKSGISESIALIEKKLFETALRPTQVGTEIGELA
jgi:HTH DNA binding domain